jgi:hypothetical protein
MPVIEIDPAAPLLAKCTPTARPLVEALRCLICEVVPQATEKVYFGWGTINYRLGGSMRDFLVAIAPQRAYANLEFRDGTLLPDPARRLDGTGKRLRHVKIRSVDDVGHPDVRALLEAAVRCYEPLVAQGGKSDAPETPSAR